MASFCMFRRQTVMCLIAPLIATACNNPAPARPASAQPIAGATSPAAPAPAAASGSPAVPAMVPSTPQVLAPCSPNGDCDGEDAGTPDPNGAPLPLPCDVNDVVKRRCQSCHAARPVAGVPMPLTTWNDFEAAARTRPTLSVRELVAKRVHDTTRPMPPNKPLPEDELKLLDSWLAAGDKPGAAAISCGSEPEPAPTEAGPPEDSTCYSLHAHGQSTPGDTSPWLVDSQHYACFYFDQPWPDGAQGVYFAPEYDHHPELVHHWIVYLDQNGVMPDGTVSKCSGLHETNPTMVAGWAPGSDNNDLPPDVGMFLSPPNKKILLEMHFYHDGVSAPIATTSGVKICTANTPRQHTATISMLGSELITVPPRSAATVQGTCTPQYNGEIHILRSWPHMHEIGAGMRTDIAFADGRTQTLGPWRFDFNNQVSYSTPVTIRPGDRLTTTCEYFNPRDTIVSTGTSTDSEMCFNFVTAYPAGALKSRNIFGASTSLTASETACLE